MKVKIFVLRMLKRSFWQNFLNRRLAKKFFFSVKTYVVNIFSFEGQSLLQPLHAAIVVWQPPGMIHKQLSVTVEYACVPIQLFAKTGSRFIWSNSHNLLTSDLDLSKMRKSWIPCRVYCWVFLFLITYCLLSVNTPAFLSPLLKTMKNLASWFSVGS